MSSLLLKRLSGANSFQSTGIICRSLSVRGVQMPDTDHKPAKFEGKSAEEAHESIKKNLFPHVSQRMLFYKKPLYLVEGYQQWLYDNEGKRYLDLFAGIATAGIGHCNPKITKAIHDQSSKLVHSSNLYMNEKQVEYAERFLATLPDKYEVCYFVNSGSEANDMAMQMMRMYTGAWDIISLRNAYHGASPHTLGITNMGQYKFPIPNNFGCYSTTNPDVYKGQWGGKNCRDSPIQADRDCDCVEGQCTAADNYLFQLQDLLDSLSSNIAGFFAEPIQGVGGAVQYPKHYLQEAYKMIRARGGLCLADEVQTGFGRTGTHFWGFQAAGIDPDIITTAKTIANGLPFAVIATTREIADSMNTALPFNTYSSNPVSCAAAIATLDVIEEDKLQQNCLEVGTYCLEELAKMRDEYEIIGDVRGKGLMIGIELVADKKNPAVPLQPERIADIMERTKEYGVIMGKGARFGQVLRIKPPMCVTKEDIDFGLAVLRQAIEENIEEFSQK